MEFAGEASTTLPGFPLWTFADTSIAQACRAAVRAPKHSPKPRPKAPPNYPKHCPKIPETHEALSISIKPS